MRFPALALALAALAGCGSAPIGREPDFTPPQAGAEATAMMTYSLPQEVAVPPTMIGPSVASLWDGGRGSLLGDRRAMQRGDIMTVVIEIDDSASISNSSDRSRTASQDMGVPSLVGIPQRLNERLPEGATLDAAVGLNSNSSFAGDGSVRRNEQLELRVAATVTDVLPNGVLQIEGRQEVRVNFELRELIVTGYVRPADISRQNEITYDKIASARISYGGRGQISDVQQPRYGQQVLENVLPF
ncbi:flagellar basal body L-ring protein FlgH [Pseudoroseicyclus aestuarii]|uniref:Flagellar L-ring protein n=1 Tax=Pseudoroseicyclus aestuarii TaxID=1795041 RepID=A0A318T2Z6_9RHOB|nr:flagellar basal body L-ring protein FlgH [Pseudoroseicyclus aestuarii]PYE84584.1 flagellar L-ring protein precursor FlgH [Pseudoroseicyclus aestuarii]